MKVGIPDPLMSYTGRQREVEAEGATVAELLHNLDRLFPGIRFRVIDEQDSLRPHMRIFVNLVKIQDLDMALSSRDEVHILQALSGG